MIIPVLGMTRSRRPQGRISIADALFTKTQQRILALLYGNPKRSLHTAEIIRLARLGSGTVQRELERLYQSGLLIALRAGNQVFYDANRDSPIFEELAAIIAKTVGLAEPLKEALSSVASQIRAACVFGSVAQGRDRAQSDIDVLIVSDELTYGDVFTVMEPLTAWLGRPVNPTIYSSAEYASRLREGNAFIARVLSQPKIWLIGSDHDLPH